MLRIRVGCSDFNYLYFSRYVIIFFIANILCLDKLYATENERLNIEFDPAYLQEIGFAKKFYFKNNRTIIYPIIPLNNAGVMEWSPDANQILLTDIWFGEKAKVRESKGDFEYRFAVIKQNEKIIKPYKLPMRGWDRPKFLAWFSNTKVAILGKVENGRINVDIDFNDNFVIIDLSTGEYFNMNIPKVDHQEIGCVDFIEQAFFNHFTGQFIIRFRDAESCGARSGTIYFSMKSSQATNFEEYSHEFTAVSLKDGIILNGKFLKAGQSNLTSSRFEKIYSYCEERSKCAFSHNLKYAQSRRDGSPSLRNEITLGQYSYNEPNPKLKNKLVTRNYVITITPGCKNNKVICDSFTYVGISKKSGKKITLKGRYYNSNCGYGSCRSVGFRFINGYFHYSVNELGQLKVKEKIIYNNKYVRFNILLQEDGEWEKS